MADFDEPVIREIAEPHALLGIPRRGIFEVNCDVAIVVGMRDVVGPDIRSGDRVKRVIGTNGKCVVVGVDFSDFKNTSRRTPIAFFFMKAIFILPIEAGTPRESAATVKDRPGLSNGLPSRAAFFVTLKSALSGIPSWSDADNELLRSVAVRSEITQDDDGYHVQIQAAHGSA